MTPLELVLSRLKDVRKSGAGWEALCPAHDDRKRSLSVTEGEDTRALVKCHAGSACDFSAIVRAIGLGEKDLFPGRKERTLRGRIVATYDYEDEKGALLYQVVRYDPKDFRQRRPDGKGGWVWSLEGVRRVLYRLPRVLETAKAGRVVYVVEGEKDVEALEALGLVATCNAAGAGKWRPEYAEPFRGLKGAVILTDNDPPGRAHALDVARSLHAAGVPVKVLELPDLPEKGDVSDWIAAGGTKAKLLELQQAAPLWSPETNAPEPANVADGGTGTDEPLGAGQWPMLAEAALQGPLGELVRVIEPHTEADPVAILAQSLVMFGNVIGRGAYYLAEADRHHSNLYAVLVGATAKGRKGTAYGRAHTIFRALDPLWPQASGLSSGEGLIHAVRDDAQDNEGDGDPGVIDKRLLVVESEYASVLRVLARDGNTLSAVVRQAWDSGTLRTLTKNSPTKATGAHISLIGHITADELRRYLDRTEAGSGFANRHLWLCARRAHVLPFGGDPSGPALDRVSEQLAAAVASARALGESRVNFDPEAAELWASEYEDLSEGAPGMLGAVTSRAEAQTVRLALLYALSDCERSIRRPHLEAALELWRYAEASARYVFGEALGDPLADELRRLLRGAGAEGLDREAIRDGLSRHSRSADIGRALGVLEAAGLARQESRPTGGRPEERWYAARKARKARKGPTLAPAGGDTAHTAHTAQAEELIQ